MMNVLWRTLGVGSAVVTATILTQACLARPVSKQEPTTKVNFTTDVRQQAVDKVDLLLAIDNSASMGDKQAILQAAIPDLVGRLLRPGCLDASGRPTGATADPTKPREAQCPAGEEPEFAPVTDLHVGIVSSSLGGMGGTTCPEQERSNDKGRLLARTKSGPSPEVGAGNFLAWFPDVPANANKPAPPRGIGDEKRFVKALQDLVVGVDQDGCGLEAQLESMHHFLVQPDPWDTIRLEAGKLPDGRDVTRASYAGLDETVLAQRKAFLRPDSLVVVILVSDEDDSAADPLSLDQTGWMFMDPTFSGGTPRSSDARTGKTAPRGTRACATNPNAPECTSCALAPSDPGCAENGGFYAADEDDMNVRFFHMKRRYGVDPQYPIRRYVQGLGSRRVPDREGEHAGGAYVGTAKCTNPLFAKNLPGSAREAIDRAPKVAGGKPLTDAQRLAAGLCDLEPGPRTPSLVYFAVLGGAPSTLLFDGAYGDNPKPKRAVDFVALLGKDPVAYDDSGADPHMLQSIGRRPGLPEPDAIGKNGPDVVHGREWDTRKQDLQYACTFPLEAPLAQPRDCSLAENARACDCDGSKAPPLCATSKGGREQVRAKAYPTIRQFAVAKGMGEQGIVASLCPLVDGAGKLFPEKLPDGRTPHPFYGYRPAVQQIVDRLKNSLANQCVPQLTRDAAGRVPCLVLEILASKGPESLCDRPDVGLERPDPLVLARFREELQKDPSSPADVGEHPVCAVTQIVKKPGETCAKDSTAGWCYVSNTESAQVVPQCPQAVVFSPAANPEVGARVRLQCIQQFGAGVAAANP